MVNEWLLKIPDIWSPFWAKPRRWSWQSETPCSCCFRTFSALRVHVGCWKRRGKILPSMFLFDSNDQSRVGFFLHPYVSIYIYNYIYICVYVYIYISTEMIECNSPRRLLWQVLTCLANSLQNGRRRVECHWTTNGFMFKGVCCDEIIACNHPNLWLKTCWTHILHHLQRENMER